MPRQLFDYDPPERFVAGTVGQPGSRTFFLQARTGTRMVSVALEKSQLEILAERVDDVLDEVVRRADDGPEVPGELPPDVEDNAPLETPIEEEFRVGTMSLAWDGDAERVIITCYSQGLTPDEEEEGEEEDPEEQDGALLRVSLSSIAARVFAKRALAVVAAGRPPCPFCAGPLDPEGHICPRANGYRR